MRCHWDSATETYRDGDDPCTTDEYGDPTKHCTARRTCSTTHKPRKR
jgi:hypothetical protein